MDFVDWAINKHAITNHMYEEYLPYEYHLRLALQVAKEFQHLVPKEDFWKYRYAIAGHDLFEDARVTYNDALTALGYWNSSDAMWIAEIILAVTEYPGRNRRERHPPAYWQHIRETPGARFVKLCDIIANVRHGTMFKNSKLDMHKKEFPNLIIQLRNKEYPEMWEHLNNLLSATSEVT